MGKPILLIIYLVVLAVDLFAVYSGNEATRYVSKALLMPLLIGFFVFTTNNFSSSLKKWVILALTFSWAGDVLLMFESLRPVFFIFGLIAFLVAHVFYIIFFVVIRRNENVVTRWPFLVFVICYYLLLMNLLQPHLGEMKWPVRVYGLVIMGMLLNATNMLYIKTRQAGLLMMVGASLFVISDSILAINKFYRQFEYAGIAVMLTYGIAQLLITLGAAKYIGSTHKFAE